MLLGDLGADVIKVEPPEGDATRGWGPPWVERGGTRMAAYFLAVNRNKRSLRLDLATPEGAEILRRLLARADVLVENFRPGTFSRLGFDDAALSTLNPRLIHLAISGYGPTGPLARRPGYDFVIQAEAGLMSITGFPDEEGGRPTKVGVAIADVVTGLQGAVALLAALAARDRPAGPAAGMGQRIDTSIFEATLAALVNQAQNALVGGRSPGRLGNAHPNIVPYETFATADGEIAVAVGSERQWRRFCTAIGLPELADDPRFASNGARVEHREALRAIIAHHLAREPSAVWLDRLVAAEVPSGAVADLLTALTGPQAQALGSLQWVEHPVMGRLAQVGPASRLSATPATVRRPPPLLGEHGAEILAEVGYDPQTIAELRRRGVV
jgi:crotonobetainyl-CoA:carnitine CoA-transferase CaiB-like acyl-CoA transferase